MLLRLSRYPSRIVPRAGTTASPSSKAPRSSSQYIPRDDGDHDPDVDLITLRRQSSSAKAPTTHPTEFRQTENDSESDQTEKVKDGASKRQDEPIINTSFPPTQSLSPLARGMWEESSGPKAPSDITDESDIHPLLSTSPPDTFPQKFDSAVRFRGEPKPANVDVQSRSVDPYLLHYLETVQPKYQTRSKRPISAKRKYSKQDSDIEFLQPNDIRATYAAKERQTQSEKASHDTITSIFTSRESGEDSGYSVNSGLQLLNIPSSGSRVVIPRAVLTRLIEQTINLSGAAVNGDSVVIERYSPTWHRFARLLRTSDLHKISRIKTQDPNPSQAGINTNILRIERDNTTDQTLKEASRQAQQETSSHPIGSISEREYVVLALDIRKRKVVSTRFRRLLDGSSEISPPPSESLLKVEFLNRHAPSNIIELMVFSGIYHILGLSNQRDSMSLQQVETELCLQGT